VRVNAEIDEEKELFLVTITDTGIGLNDKELHLLRTSPRKLEPNIISRKRDGWGIGMQTMQKFCGILGASFHIESNIGLGTKLSFGFPVSFRKVASNMATPVPSQFDSVRSIFYTKNTQVHESSVKVLIIDNDKEYLELMSEQFSPAIIKRSDVEVSLTNDVPLALERMEEVYFDLILIDYHMEKDGLYVLRHIDQNENLCKNSIKHIITVDSQIDEQTTTEMLKLSNGILNKGISTSDLRSLLQRAILNAV
jgi:CheY-like chemotaxis protein